MNPIRLQNDDRTLLNRWSQQIAARRGTLGRADRLNRVAIGYVTREHDDFGLIALDQVIFVVVTYERLGHGRQSIRVSGFAGSSVPWGVKWGGSANHRFCKDLSLPPIPNGSGRNLDLNRPDVVDLAMRLERRLCQRYPCRSRNRRLRLPRLWAAIEPSFAADVTLDGPELMSTSRRTGKHSTALREQMQRYHRGFILLPLDWVSHAWESFAAVFADLTTIPKQQVVESRRIAKTLRGFRGACEFDFLTSRFGQARNTRCKNRKSATAISDVA
jgi:hypothetical protein